MSNEIKKLKDIYNLTTKECKDLIIKYGTADDAIAYLQSQGKETKKELFLDYFTEHTNFSKHELSTIYDKYNGNTNKIIKFIYSDMNNIKVDNIDDIENKDYSCDYYQNYEDSDYQKQEYEIYTVDVDSSEYRNIEHTIMSSNELRAYINNLINGITEIDNNEYIGYSGTNMGCGGIIIALIITVIGFAFGIVGGIIGLIIGASISKSMNNNDVDAGIQDIKKNELAKLNNLFHEQYNKYIEKYKDCKIKNASLSSTNMFDYSNETIQYIINEKELIILPISLYDIKVYYSFTDKDKEKERTYIIPYFNQQETLKPIIIKKDDIVGYTYYGTEVVKTDVTGGGTDIQGAILGGLLFGAVGAIIGSKEETKIKSKQIDLREVQINLKDNKMIVIKGINIYQDLLCYFPSKNLNKN